MKILITGCNGFIGSNFLKLASREFGIKNLHALSSSKNFSCHTTIYCGIDQLDQIKSDSFFNTEILIHAGAYIPKSHDDPDELIKCNENIIFTNSLLNKKFPNLKRIIYLSTVDVYKADEIIDETSITEPTSLYGWSKLYCEKIVEKYSEKNDISYSILRIGHVYGPGEEKFKKFLPICLSNITQGKDIEIWGDGEDLRTLIYVDDVCNAILKASRDNKVPNIINVVGSRAMTIKEIINIAIKVSKKNIRLNKIHKKTLKKNYVFNCTIMKKFLLNKQIDIEYGIKKELEYFRNKYDNNF